MERGYIRGSRLRAVASAGSLVFVGLGLHDAKDVSVRGLEAVRAADFVFLERYTSVLPGASVADLERLYGKPIRILGRKEVEDGSLLLDAARGSRVALLVAGDSMAATTHSELRVRAIRAGLHVEVVPGASIVSIVPGLLGLQGYKFGRATTVPFPRPGFAPESPYEVIAANRRSGLHTLVLLDIDTERERFLTANEAIRILLDIEKRRGEGAVAPSSLVLVVARAGSREPLLVAGPPQRMADAQFGPPLHTIVVPGELHFQEEEALRALARWV